MITMLQMQYFVAVAETKSFTEASKQQFVSQQTLSVHISQLEKEIGAPLFYRTRPLTITPVGERLLQGAREILHTNQIMQKELRDMVAPEQGTIQIGVSHAHAHLFIPAILEDFFQKCPHANLRIREMTFEEMLSALRGRQIDLAIARPPFPYGNVRYVPLSFSDDLYLYAPDHALQKCYGSRAARVRERLLQEPSLKVVSDAPFIITKEGTVRDILIKHMMQDDIVPNIKIETTSLETAINLSMRGFGISACAGRLLFPKVMGGPSKDPTAYGCYLIQKDVTDYALSLCMLSNVTITHIMQEFINTTRHYLESVRQSV